MRKAFWRLLRLIGIGLLVVLVLVISGVLLADRLTPRATAARPCSSKARVPPSSSQKP